VTVFLLVLALLALAVLGLSVTILVKKDGKFPDGEISHNKELRRRGVICAKEEELRLWRKRHPSATVGSGQRPESCPESGCDGCAFLQQPD
jgi:hypothetical protein